MKLVLALIIECSFSIVLGLLCGAYGIRFVENPFRYLLINMPLIGVFCMMVSMLKTASED